MRSCKLARVMESSDIIPNLDTDLLSKRQKNESLKRYEFRKRYTQQILDSYPELAVEPSLVLGEMRTNILFDGVVYGPNIMNTLATIDSSIIQ